MGNVREALAYLRRSLSTSVKCGMEKQRAIVSKHIAGIEAEMEKRGNGITP
jgi:hypothetical protein